MHKNNLLDLTALTTLRRKSRSAANLHAEIDRLNSSSKTASFMTNAASYGDMASMTSEKAGDAPALSRSSSGSSQTPRRRGSRSGSVSGLTAEQAIALSATYGAELDNSSSARQRSFDAEKDVSGSADQPTLSRSGSSRRDSHDASAFDVIRMNSNAGIVSSSGRRKSIDHSSEDGTNAGGGGGEGTNRERRKSFEKQLVAAAQDVMQHKKGQSIQSIAQNPSYGLTPASTQRGISLITHNICLGGRDDAADLGACRKAGITHVLNLAQQLPNFQENDLICKKMSLEDREDFDILSHLPEASKFISLVENIGGRVLVHCISGVSRSATMVLMHLINKHGLPLKDAYDCVLSCRPWIAPNDGFKLQLTQLEMQKFGSSSVSAKNSGKVWEFYAWNSRKAELEIMVQAERDRILGKHTGGGGGGCIGSILGCILG